MSISNPNKPITKGDLKQFYDTIRPYMGGLVSSKAGFTPVGTIISVMGTTAPANYLACNGQIVDVADYPELADYFENQFGTKYKFGGSGTAFGIPDLRGEFLRGTGTNSHTDQGNGASVGEHQDATAVPNFWISGDGTSLSWYGKTGTGIVEPDTEIIYNTDATRRNATPSSTGGTGNEHCRSVRPTNTSVLYCIATKNFYIDPSHDYSTSEKVIGTWIDGKPIYEKVLTFNDDINFTQSDWLSIIQIPNGNELIDIKCIHNTTIRTPPCIFGIINGYLKYYSESALPVYYKANKIIIKYTKTTD